MIQLFNENIIKAIQKAFQNYIIITDDGHGWFTQGKCSFTEPPFYENEFNSVVEAKLLYFLDICKIEHYQLSPGSIDTELKNRDLEEYKITIDAEKRGKIVLGVSIHCDAFGDKQNDANGFCVYYYGKGTAFSKNGCKLARCVADSIIKSDKENGYFIKPRHEYGISNENFFILRETDGVWILIENGFMTNNSELTYLRNDSFRNNRAMAIFEGLYNYII